MATDFIGCRFESRILLFVSFSSVGALGVGHDGFYTTQDYPEHWRRIRFNDPESGKTLIFLTHNTALPTLTIAALYKSRWQVELFFNWIKQHRRIKKFLDNSENAVKTPIGCAVSTYLLLAIVKKELQREASRYTLLPILSVSIFEKPPALSAFQADTGRTISTADANQRILFDF